MTIQLFNSNDADAPTVRYQVGDLIKVLDACLVYGYGSTPSAGWSKVYEDVPNNVAVYRAPAGNRCYLRVNDNQTYFAFVQAYASMSDVDTGTEPFSNYYSGAAQFSKWWKTGQTSTAQYGNWELISSDKSFYWITPGYLPSPSYFTNHWYYRNMFMFGDYVCMSDTFPYNTMIMCENRTDHPSEYQYWQQGQYFGSGAKYCRRGWNEMDVPTAISMETIHGNGSYIGSHSIFTYPDKLTGTMHVDRIRLRQDSTFMGYMPGLYDIITPIQSYYPHFWEGSGALVGKTFYTTIVYGAALTFQVTGDWYDPVVG